MHDEAYRLWQRWQQMHYPRRGLPADESVRAALVTLDGTAGTVLDRYFRRGARAKTLDAAARATLGRCRDELDLGNLSADAGRYFSRLRRLSELVLAEVAPAGSAQLAFQPEPLAAKDST
ncbi:MAG: hypothetical protein H0W81_09855 [Chloroflexi bacterium]|nr:hypothetical protein [Chloroflexota bacterium]